MSQKWFQRTDQSKTKIIANESEEFRWFLFGKKLHSSTGRTLFHHTCWDCMYDNLNTVIDIRRVARKSKWYKRIENGERPIPLNNIMAAPYFKLIFDITDEELKQQSAQLATASEVKFIKKYGEETGKQKFLEYCQKQRIKNTKEYKMKVKGWTEQQFNEYNASRASTYENYIKRYGKEDGEKRWNEYCTREAYAGNKLEYYIEKYGEEEGKIKYLQVNALKAPTLENFIRIYGNKEGKIKYAQIIGRGYSNISQKLFAYVDKLIGDMAINSRYALKNGEYVINVFFEDGTCKACRPDYILNTKIIEFNGNYWHANPKFYVEYDIIVYPDSQVQQAKDIWSADAKRKEALEKLGYKVLVVWESEYIENPVETVIKCVEFLKCTN